MFEHITYGKRIGFNRYLLKIGDFYKELIRVNIPVIEIPGIKHYIVNIIKPQSFIFIFDGFKIRSGPVCDLVTYIMI